MKITLKEDELQEEKRKENWKRFADELRKYFTKRVLGPEWEKWELEVHYFSPPETNLSEPERSLACCLTGFLNKYDDSKILKAWYRSDQLDEEIRPPCYNLWWRELSFNQRISSLTMELFERLKGKTKRQSCCSKSKMEATLENLPGIGEFYKERW